MVVVDGTVVELPPVSLEVVVESSDVDSVVPAESEVDVVVGSVDSVVLASGSLVVVVSGRKVVGGSGPGPVLTVLGSLKVVVVSVVEGVVTEAA